MKQAAHQSRSATHARAAGERGGRKRPDKLEQARQQAGNLAIQGAVQEATQGHFLQTKMAVSQPDDPHERQADQVAEQVMRMPAARPVPPRVSRLSGGIDRKCSGCEEDQQASPMVHRKKRPGPDSPTAKTHPGRIAADLGGGQSLSQQTRAFFEPRFGRSFNDVRVHAGGTAQQMATSLNARAFTTGNDIVFAPGQYRPGTTSGRQLLAHELTHVIQQSGNPAARLVQRKPNNKQSTQKDGKQPLSEMPDELAVAGGFADWKNINVATFTNGEILYSIRTNQEWLSANGIVVIEYSDREAYQKRLVKERENRIQAGATWMQDPAAEKLTAILQLRDSGGKIEVSSYQPARYLNMIGVGKDASRILSPDQFAAYLNSNGISGYDSQAWKDAEALVKAAQKVKDQQQGLGIGAGDAALHGVANTNTSPKYGKSFGDQYAKGFLSTGAHGFLAESAFGAKHGGLDTNSKNWRSWGRSPSDNFLIRQLQRNTPFSQGEKVPGPMWFQEWQRGNYPMADFDSYHPFAIKPVSVKSSVQDKWSARRDFFLEGHAAMLGTDQTKGGRPLAAYLRNAPPGTTQADVARAGTLAINPGDVQRLQNIYSNLTQVEAAYQEGGKTVTPGKMNLDRAGVGRVVSGYLQASPVTIKGKQYSSASVLIDDYKNNVITHAELTTALRPIGQMAAGAVRSNEMPRSELNTLKQNRIAHGQGTRKPLQMLGSDYFDSMLYGKTKATGLHAWSGGKAGAVMGGGMKALMVAMNPEDYEDPGGAIIEATALGMGTGLAEGGLGHYFARQATAPILGSGVPLTASSALGIRSVASGKAGGIVAVLAESGIILSEDRRHSAEEVVYRVGRSGGIGFVSTALGTAAGTATGAWAGATFGTAVGGPVGFIVGLAVGLAVGALLNAIIPDYEQMVVEQVPLSEFEKNLQAQTPQSIKNQILAQQAYDLLFKKAHAPKYRGPFDLDEVYDKHNLTNSPGQRNVYEALITGEIDCATGYCHAIKDINRYDAQFPMWHEARTPVIDQLTQAAIEEWANRGPKPKFLDYDMPGQTVPPWLHEQVAGQGTAEDVAKLIDVIQPNIGQWQTILGPDIIPPRVASSPMSDLELYNFMLMQIDEKQSSFEADFGKLDEDDIKLYKDLLEKANKPKQKPKPASKTTYAPSLYFCFTAGTRVAMADGSEQPIETIAKGNLVMAYDESTDAFAVSEVLKTHTNIEVSALRITLDNQRAFTVTPRHRFFIHGEWVRAEDMQPGQLCLSYTPAHTEGNRQYSSVKSIEAVELNEPVYNLTVARYHTYIAEGLVVHNAKP